MKRSKVGNCVYCGEQATLTREHVIPECLFTKPLPDNMVTVGACLPCNNGKSSDDTYLRDYLLADMASDTNAAALNLRSTSLKRSVQSNRSEIARLAFRWASPTAIRTPGGIYTGKALAVPFDGTRIVASYKKIICGLHYHVSNIYLPFDYDFHIDRVSPNMMERWDNMLNTNPGIIGNNAEIFIGLYRFLYFPRDDYGHAARLSSLSAAA